MAAGVAPRRDRPGGLAGPLAGGAYVFRGIRTFLAMPQLRLIGMLPVLLAGALVLALLAVLVASLDQLAAALTPFAASWSPDVRMAVRASVGLTILLAYLLVAMLLFAAITNIIGQPFYERISDRVEARLGSPPPGVDAPWWRTAPRATVESLVLLALVLLAGAPLFLLGFIPVVGQTAVPVAGALVSGFFLALELLAIPLQRRGMHLRERLGFVWRHRSVTVGFGVTAFLLFLVPLMSLIAMPGAIVGGTLLVRRLTGLPDR